MSEDIIRAARQEEERLLRDLQAMPIYQKLEAVRALLAAYSVEPLPQTATVTAEGRGTLSISAKITAASRPRIGSKAAEVVDAAIQYLRQTGRRAQSSEIVEGLTKMGIHLDAPNPTSVVSSYLSTSKIFDNVRGKGYGLAEWANDSSPPDLSSVEKATELLTPHSGSETCNPTPESPSEGTPEGIA
jgi:hypothetical protein